MISATKLKSVDFYRFDLLLQDPCFRPQKCRFFYMDYCPDPVTPFLLFLVDFSFWCCRFLISGASVRGWWTWWKQVESWICLVNFNSVVSWFFDASVWDGELVESWIRRVYWWTWDRANFLFHLSLRFIYACIIKLKPRRSCKSCIYFVVHSLGNCLMGLQNFLGMDICSAKIHVTRNMLG